MMRAKKNHRFHYIYDDDDDKTHFHVSDPIFRHRHWNTLVSILSREKTYYLHHSRPVLYK